MGRRNNAGRRDEGLLIKKRRWFICARFADVPRARNAVSPLKTATVAAAARRPLNAPVRSKQKRSLDFKAGFWEGFFFENVFIIDR